MAQRAECWGRWAIDYQTAMRDAPVIRQQIEAARAKGQTQQ
jgi:hypothetical protein